MNIFSRLTILLILSSVPCVFAITTEINIGSIKCKGTLIKAKNSLAIITAGHCLRNYNNYDFVRKAFITTANGLIKEARTIKEVIYSSEGFKNDALTTIPSKEESDLKKSTWCKNNHQDDIALVILQDSNYESLVTSITSNNLLNSNLVDPQLVIFKGYEVQGLAFKDYQFTSHVNSAAGIVNGNSGTPLYIDGKIAGVEKNKTLPFLY